jgi:hypothetical protein
MTARINTGDVEQDSIVRGYFLACMAAMFVLLLLLLRRGFGPWSVAPVVVGVAGTAWRRRGAPLAALVVLAGIFIGDKVASLLAVVAGLPTIGLASDFLEDELGASSNSLPPFNGSLANWILSAAMLAYTMAHYRLLGLSVAYFPDEAREATSSRSVRADLSSGKGESVRRATSDLPAEMSWYFLCLPVWAMLAQLIWKLVPPAFSRFQLQAPYGMEASTWQGTVLAWMLSVGMFLVAGLFSYAIWQQRTRRAAALLLQDVVWRETCRDERLNFRALVRARVRRRRREEV